MSCAGTDTLNSTFSNACVVASAGASIGVNAAFAECCGDSDIHLVDNGCYTYCNTTSTLNPNAWQFCMVQGVGAEDWENVDSNCFAEAVPQASSSQAASAVSTSASVTVATTAVSSSTGIPATKLSSSTSKNSSSATVISVSSTPASTLASSNATATFTSALSSSTYVSSNATVSLPSLSKPPTTSSTVTVTSSSTSSPTSSSSPIAKSGAEMKFSVPRSVLALAGLVMLGSMLA